VCVFSFPFFFSGKFTPVSDEIDEGEEGEEDTGDDDVDEDDVADDDKSIDKNDIFGSFAVEVISVDLSLIVSEPLLSSSVVLVLVLAVVVEIVVIVLFEGFFGYSSFRILSLERDFLCIDKSLSRDDDVVSVRVEAGLGKGFGRPVKLLSDLFLE